MRLRRPDGARGAPGRGGRPGGDRRPPAPNERWRSACRRATTRAARASRKARATAGSFSAASAVSSGPSASASRERKIDSADSRRFAGSGLIMVRLPIACAMARRSRLLTLTGFMPLASTWAAAPVLASRRLPSGALMKTALSAARASSRPSARASRIAWAVGRPLPASAKIPCSTSAKPEAENLASAASAASWARAGMASSTVASSRSLASRGMTGGLRTGRWGRRATRLPRPHQLGVEAVGLSPRRRICRSRR